MNILSRRPTITKSVIFIGLMKHSNLLRIGGFLLNVSLIITIKRTKDLNYFSLCALNLFNTRVSQFELNYWNKWTFPRHSNLLRCTCTTIKLILRKPSTTFFLKAHPSNKFKEKSSIHFHLISLLSLVFFFTGYRAVVLGPVMRGPPKFLYSLHIGPWEKRHL